MFPWSESLEALRLDRFMAAALHDPESGYYARRIRMVGPRGDFSTAATLSPALGRAVSRWASASLRKTGCHHLIELGPGGGELAAAVLGGLPRTQRWGVRLHLVEGSEPLRERQRGLLGKRVRWHETAAEALDACGGRACVYSNEFLDAFPVRRFRRNRDEWEESWALPGREIWRPAGPIPESSAIRREWPDGQVVEIHQAVREWFGETLPHWKQGRMLTIDYGTEVDGLYQRQPDGSLRGYFHHQVVSGNQCFTRPGHQDLTADLNFTDLREWASPWARTTRLESQTDFLAGHAQSDEPADRLVADPHGAGGAFLVWESECGA